MWATHRWLSKPCANTASCPSPSGTGGSRWSHRFMPEQIGEQDYGLAYRTAASESHRAPKQAALGATPLTEGLFAATRTFVHRVCHQQPLALELLAEDDRIHGGQWLVAQPIGPGRRWLHLDLRRLAPLHRCPSALRPAPRSRRSAHRRTTPPVQPLPGLPLLLPPDRPDLYRGTGLSIGTANCRLTTYVPGMSRLHPVSA